MSNIAETRVRFGTSTVTCSRYAVRNWKKREKEPRRLDPRYRCIHKKTTNTSSWSLWKIGFTCTAKPRMRMRPFHCASMCKEIILLCIKCMNCSWWVCWRGPWPKYVHTQIDQQMAMNQRSRFATRTSYLCITSARPPHNWIRPH